MAESVVEREFERCKVVKIVSGGVFVGCGAAEKA